MRANLRQAGSTSFLQSCTPEPRPQPRSGLRGPSAQRAQCCPLPGPRGAVLSVPAPSPFCPGPCVQSGAAAELPHPSADFLSRRLPRGQVTGGVPWGSSGKSCFGVTVLSSPVPTVGQRQEVRAGPPASCWGRKFLDKQGLGSGAGRGQVGPGWDTLMLSSAAGPTVAGRGSSALGGQFCLLWRRRVEARRPGCKHGVSPWPVSVPGALLGTAQAPEVRGWLGGAPWGPRNP